MLRACSILALASTVAFSQKYAGPRPPKPDVPYLLHANRLVETEQSEAREEKRKEDTVYVVSGASSNAKTPLAEPIFIFESRKIPPERLKLFRLEPTKNGSREIVFPPPNKRKKDAPRPLYMSVTRLGDGLFRLEAQETLPNGEYSLSPDESNQVFCFQVY